MNPRTPATAEGLTTASFLAVSPRPRSALQLSIREFQSHRAAVIGLGILVFFVLFSFVGPLLYPTNQTYANPLESSQPPSPAHPLGTDNAGFDVLGRLMLGGQSTLEIAFAVALIATVLGTLYGAIAGLIGGAVDAVMMRFVDVLLSIPFLFVVLILATKFQGSVLTLSLVIGLFSWLVPSRLVRGEVLSLRVRDFVSAATVMGSSRSRIVVRHLIPNALSVVVVNITFQIADAILALSYLGFLGLGLTFPDVSWGDMLGGAQAELANGSWWLVYPVGICVVLVVLGANFVGDGLRDTFDVRLRRR